MLNKSKMRRFQLHRSKDVSGVSGIGVVAEGVQLTSGKVVLTWFGAYKAISVYDNIDTVREVHGHEGKTKIVFLDKKL